MRRFWTTASHQPRDGQWEVLLDDRPLRTPARHRLLLPNPALAAAIAAEWRQADDTFAPAALPFTALANAAIDIVAPDPGTFVATLARYAAFDLVCYRAAGPAALVERQQRIWEPLLRAVEARHGLSFRHATGIVHVAQPPETLAGVTALLAARSTFELAALQPLISIGGSVVLALALLAGIADADAAHAASLLDERFQQERWGADPEADRLHALRQGEYRTAARFLALAGQQPPETGSLVPAASGR